MLQEIFLAITDGLKRMSVRVGLIDILQNVVKILAMLLFFQVAPGATVAFGALGVATLASCLVAGLQASRLVPLRLQFPLDRSLLRYSYPLLFAKFISMLYGWTDTLVIGLMMTARDVGVYNAALPTAMLLLIPSQCILSIYLPLIAELVSRNEREDISVIHHRVTRWIVLLTLPATLFQIAFSREIVIALFGEAYAQAGPALAVLAIGFLIQAASKPSATLLHAFKETRRVPMITLGSLALNLALNILLVREVGIVGAAVATSLTSIATGVAYWTMTRRLVRLHWRELGLLKPLGAAALATGGVMYIMTWTGHSLPALIAAAAAVMGGYVMLLWLSHGFDRMDLAVLLQAINKLGIDSPALERLAIAPDDQIR
jgi:O-antigen/teichoic acid export membrane protein